MTCPQSGTYGFHSSRYYDGAPCDWCGAVMPADQLAELNEMIGEENE